MLEKNALILLSGGLDSFTAAAFAQSQGFKLFAISFDYGQRHRIELEKIKKILEFLKIEYHQTIKIDASIFANSALIDKDRLIPKAQNFEAENSIPITYVPARNIIFLSYALALAETRNLRDIFIGANIIDYSGYPDCRPEFLESFAIMANLGTSIGGEKNPIKIHAPLIDLTKSEIIKLGLDLGLDYSLTHSCYDPNELGQSCGKCDSCRFRLKAFADNQIADPINYVYSTPPLRGSQNSFWEFW